MSFHKVNYPQKAQIFILAFFSPFVMQIRKCNPKILYLLGPRKASVVVHRLKSCQMLQIWAEWAACVSWDLWDPSRYRIFDEIFEICMTLTNIEKKCFHEHRWTLQELTNFWSVPYNVMDILRYKFLNHKNKQMKNVDQNHNMTVRVTSPSIFAQVPEGLALFFWQISLFLENSVGLWLFCFWALGPLINRF